MLLAPKSIKKKINKLKEGKKKKDFRNQQPKFTPKESRKRK